MMPAWILHALPPHHLLISREDMQISTFDQDVAEYYACYAKRRSMCSAAIIIHITIPNSAIESLSALNIQLTYWPRPINSLLNREVLSSAIFLG